MTIRGPIWFRRTTTSSWVTIGTTRSTAATCKRSALSPRRKPRGARGDHLPVLGIPRLLSVGLEARSILRRFAVGHGSRGGDPTSRLSRPRSGHRFRDRGLLEEALRHRSHLSVQRGKARDNQRLEFLGDRVLGLAIAAELFAVHPEASEGELHTRFEALVCRASCAAAGRRAGLGPHLILSRSEIRSGFRDRDTVLADAMEAVLAAVFLDGGGGSRKPGRAPSVFPVRTRPGGHAPARGQGSRNGLRSAGSRACRPTNARQLDKRLSLHAFASERRCRRWAKARTSGPPSARSD